MNGQTVPAYSFHVSFDKNALFQIYYNIKFTTKVTIMVQDPSPDIVFIRTNELFGRGCSIKIFHFLCCQTSMTCLWWIALDGKYIKRGRAERLPVKWWNNHTYGCIAYKCVVVWYNSLRNRDACISTHYVWKCPILCFSLYFHLNWGDGHKMRKEKSPKLNQNRGCCFDVPSAIIICLLGCSSLKEMERWSERWYQVFEFMCSWQHAALLPFCMFIDAYNKHVVSLASRVKDWGEKGSVLRLKMLLLNSLIVQERCSGTSHRLIATEHSDGAS